MRFRFVPSVTVAVVSLYSSAKAQTAGPPPTPVRMITDTLFDTTVTDPYRWLENVQDTAVVAWLHAQADYTARLLEAIPGRAELVSRIQMLSNAGPRLNGIKFGGARVFYLKRLPGEDISKLYVRDSLTARERMLVDPERLRQPGGPHWAIDFVVPSWDGHYVAYGTSPGGSENTTLRVLDVTTGQLLPDSIDRIESGLVSWRPDGHSLFLTRDQKLPPGAPPVDRYRRSRVYLHQLGRPDTTDIAVVGVGVTGRVPLRDEDFPSITTIPGSPWAFVLVYHGVQNELAVLVAPLAEVRDSGAPWKSLVTSADSVTQFDVHGDDVYLLSHNHAPRYQVLRASLLTRDVSHATVVAPETEAL